MLNRLHPIAVACALLGHYVSGPLQAQNRYATSDNMSGFVHRIDLYDASNTRIDPTTDFPPPYSPEKTCGRCHEFNTISHGWHFNAIEPGANHGRPGQPWIWSDHRTGTHLPLSYRGWPGTYNPDDLGISRWQVAAKFGGYLPGGGPGAAESLTDPAAKGTVIQPADDRSKITGSLPVDCMLCHHNEGSDYSPFVWTEQIESQNFAYAPTAALGLAEISGTMSRLKELDAESGDAASRLPKVSYDLDRFRSDGKVFIDLVRKPKNSACYYCHTNVPADSIAGRRWLHDEDVHLRAGLACADCHRNSLDHHTVRGYSGEQHPAGSLIASLSCQGCHVGSGRRAVPPLGEAGRLGAPKPAHRGLPPLHFDIMSCTACHSGPLPEPEVGRLVNSIAHRLGEHVKRTGNEFPGIVGAINLPVAHDPPAWEVSINLTLREVEERSAIKYTPHRLMWPSYWATLEAGRVTVLNPEAAYELIRRPLKVRRDFTEELAAVSLSLSQRKELLGDDRARVKEEERTPAEQQKLEAAETVARQQQVDQRLADALAAIEEAHEGKQAVYISGGVGFVRDGDARVKSISTKELGNAAEPYAWPLAHNVRPARHSLGSSGCVECHSDESQFFRAKLSPVGLLPDQDTEAIEASTLQKIDLERLKNWNRLFVGRANFKIASFIALSATCLIALSALAWNIGSFWRRRR